MRKDKERNTAHILYIEQGKSAKEIAELLGVSEKTISVWVNKYGWKSRLTAKVTSRDARIDNLKRIIDNIAEQRIELQAELSDLVKTNSDKERRQQIRMEMAGIDGTIANWNKTLEHAEKETRITLGTYLTVMERVFRAMQVFDSKLHYQTIAFQEQHTTDITNELG